MNLFTAIKEPCHQKWNKMLPSEHGKFCEVCSKQVHDLTKLNAMQIADYVKAKGGNTCVRYVVDMDEQLKKAKIFFTCLFLAFGPFLFHAKAGSIEKQVSVSSSLLFDNVSRDNVTGQLPSKNDSVKIVALVSDYKTGTPLQQSVYRSDNDSYLSVDVNGKAEFSIAKSDIHKHKKIKLSVNNYWYHRVSKKIRTQRIDANSTGPITITVNIKLKEKKHRHRYKHVMGLMMF